MGLDLIGAYLAMDDLTSLSPISELNRLLFRSPLLDSPDSLSVYQDLKTFLDKV